MAGKRPFEIDGANRIPLIGGDGWAQVRQRPGVAELECVGRVKYVYTLSVTIFPEKEKVLQKQMHQSEDFSLSNQSEKK